MSKRKSPESAKEIVRRYNEGERDFRDVSLRGASLHGAILIGADLGNADLSEADLRGADLRQTDLRGANLSMANLNQADLRGAKLADSWLTMAQLIDAQLFGADLSGARLYDAVITRNSLRGAIYELEELGTADLFSGESADHGILPLREILERWSANPVKVGVRLHGPRIASRHLFAVIGAIEHYYCSLFTMLHRPYENAGEMNSALRSPFHEVPEDYLLAVETVKAGSIELVLGMPAAIGTALLALGRVLKLRNTYLDGELKARDVQLKDLAIQEKWLDVQKKKIELKITEESQETAIQKVDNGVAFPPLSTDEGEHPSPIALAVAGKYRRMELTPNLSQEECARVIDGGCDRIRRVMEYTEKNDVVIELELSDLEDIEDL